MTTQYLPNRGDIVWMVFDPTLGREQAGRRPALVLSEKRFTEASGFSIVCPITSKVRGIPSEVKLQETKTRGATLPMQVKSLDVTARQLRFIEQAPKAIIEETAEKVGVFIGLEL